MVFWLLESNVHNLQYKDNVTYEDRWLKKKLQKSTMIRYKNLLQVISKVQAIYLW